MWEWYNTGCRNTILYTIYIMYACVCAQLNSLPRTYKYLMRNEYL